MSTAKQDLTFYNKTERPWLSRLDRSAIVGHTTATSSKLWFRMKSAGDYQVVIAKQALKGKLNAAPVNAEGVLSLATLDGDVIPLVALIDIQVDGSTDFTAVVDTAILPQIGALEPDTHYAFALYNVALARWELGNTNAHGFKTLPLDGNGPWDITFGMYSCHMPFDPKAGSSADASMWALLESELKFHQARFVIGGGDQVYADGTDYLSIWAWLRKIKKLKPCLEDMRSWYRDIYRGYWGFPHVQAVHRQLPNYMIWDDHEIMDGWGSYTDNELSNTLDSLFEWENKKKNLKLARQMFEAAKQTYIEYQHGHNPTTAQGQFDYPFSHCGADYLVLDMRGQRDFERKHYAILGEDQVARMQSWAQNLSAERDGPIFVVSTVPVVHLKDFVSNTLDWLNIFGARDDVRDHWAHQLHHVEFSLLLTTLFECAERTRRPLVILSGDVHIGCVFELFGLKQKYPNARVFQVTSSAISYAALGPLKLQLLAKSVVQKGEIGVYQTAKGQKHSGFGFRNHLIFPQYNFALLRYRTDGQTTTHIDVEFVGKSTDGRVKESHRLDLLAL